MAKILHCITCSRQSEPHPYSLLSIYFLCESGEVFYLMINQLLRVQLARMEGFELKINSLPKN